MAQPVNGNPHMVGDYNVERARYLLDYADYTPGDGGSCITFICATIVNIWKTIQRLFNCIFGDHIWYNNDTAIEVLRTYASGGFPEAHEDVVSLYRDLQWRAYDSCCGCADQSYAEHFSDQRISRQIYAFALENGLLGMGRDPENPPYQGGVPPFNLPNYDSGDDDDIEDRHHDRRQNPPAQIGRQTAPSSSTGFNWQPAASNRSAAVPSPQLSRAATDEKERYRQFFRRGETGNIVLLDLTATHNRSQEEFQESQAVLEASLRDHTCRIPEEVDGNSEEEINANYAQAFENLAAIYAPRSYQSKPTDRVDGVESEPSETLASAKDPYDLFRIALKEAVEELQIQTRQLQTSGFISMPLMQQACRLAIFNLLSQASVRTDDCEGPYVVFNDNLKARYQKPIIVYAPGEDNEMVPTVLYRADILSSTRTGCDPEGARRLLKDIEDRGTVEEFKNHLLNGTPAVDKDIKILKELMDTMANQMKERYCPTILPMVVKDLNNQREDAPLPLSSTPNQNPDFKTYTDGAKTPFEYLKRGVLWSIQKYACAGLFTEDDIAPYDEPNLSLFDPLKNLVFRNTVFGMIINAQPVHDFRLKLSSNLELECGNFYGYEPSVDDKGKLVSNLRFIPNELSGDGTEFNPASDPIKAKHTMMQLTSSELEFFETYMNADALQRIYEVKGMTEGNTPQALAAKNILRDARARLDAMAPDRKALIGELFYQITKIVTCIKDSYYTKFAPDIGNAVDFPENVAPVVVNYAPPRPVEEMITQGVKWEFLSCQRNEVTIKDRPVRTSGTTSKVNLAHYNQFGQVDWRGALSSQNNVIHNPAQCGNCMYGALSLEIFGDRASRDIERYAGILRAAAADYILANKEAHIPLMLKPTDRPRNGETEDQMVARLRPDLDARLREYCAKVRNNNTLEWGTAMEMEAIAAVIGTPVHVFYTAHPMRVGREGIEDGVIQPNSILGGRFTGAPIRLLYSGWHYEPIRLFA